MEDLRIFKLVDLDEDDILVKIVGVNGDYSISSQKDPEPDGYCYCPGCHDDPDWVEITREEAAEILGYDPFLPDDLLSAEHPEEEENW